LDIYLEKVDPESDCFRYYSIRTTSDLFEDGAVMVQWGRIGRRGRVAIRGSGSVARCEELGRKILSLRLKHGYRLRRK